MNQTPQAVALQNAIDQKVDQAVAWLQARKESMEEELTLRAKEIGDFLLQHFFDGDLQLVASQNPSKSMSFRKLCLRADLPFPESALRRFIHVAINFHFLPAEKATALLPSHHSVLYQVADVEERREIGVEAAEHEFSVRQLRQVVKGKGRRRPGAGRKPTSEFEKNWRQLTEALENLAQTCKDEDHFVASDKLCEVLRQSRDVRDQLNKIIDHVTDLPRELNNKEE